MSRRYGDTVFSTIDFPHRQKPAPSFKHHNPALTAAILSSTFSTTLYKRPNLSPGALAERGFGCIGGRVPGRPGERLQRAFIAVWYCGA